VLSKPITINGTIGANGRSRVNLSIHAQLIERAVMGGESEQQALTAFDGPLCSRANALGAEHKKEHGVS
jgi:hypothetical protein